MAAERSSTMDEPEIHRFLDRGGTGVLSLARADVPYAAPVSYGYDRTAEAFYLRLGTADASEKRPFVESSAVARLVVYDRVGDGWKSVIAVGTLERVPDDALTVEVANSLRRADLPLFDIWDESLTEVEFEVYRLGVERLSGRKAGRDAPG